MSYRNWKIKKNCRF